MPKQTPSQTVGPYFAYGLTPQPYGRLGIADGRIVNETVPGERIIVTGRVIDGAGAPVIDSLVEVWQADFQGRYAHPADGRGADFHGFGRTGTDETGTFRIETVKPGRVVGSDAKPQAPHLNVTVFARGMPNHAFTRIYFSDESSRQRGGHGAWTGRCGPARNADRHSGGDSGRAGLPLRRQSAGG